MTEISMNVKKAGLKKACAWALAAGLCLTMIPVGAGTVLATTTTTVKSAQTQGNAPTTTQTTKTEGNAPTAPSKNQTDGNAVEAANHDYAVTVTKATPTQDGAVVKTCKDCGQVVTDAIAKVNKTKISKTTCTYSGNVKKPTVTVIDANGAVIPKTEYTVVYKDNKKVGTASAVITFNANSANYSGQIVKTFKINPIATSIDKVASTKKGFKVTWDKQASQTTGYQIRYSTKSNMASAKTVTITKNSTTAKTIKNLSASKKYYVQVRTYKTVDGKKYYSGWSATETVKTLK